MKVSDTNQTVKSLKFSLLDGIFASSMAGFTQDYFVPFLLLLGATARHVGMLSALPNLFASLLQLKSADLTEKFRSRKKIINIFVLLQTFMLLPIALITLLGLAKPIVLIVLVVLFTSFGALAVPPWASLMSDLVAENKRGAYFGWRNRTFGFVIVTTTFVAGAILHIMKKINVFYGFLIIFSLAFIFRMVSWYFLTRMHEPPLDYKKENYFNLVDFLSRIRESNFAKFTLFVSLMNFSVYLASPFFAVLMLKDLHFSYILYSLITIAATLTIYLMMSRWGRHADIFGNIKIIKFTSMFIGLIPLLWIFNRNPVFLFFAQIFSGFLWSGFNLCITNFIYDAVTAEKRTRCIAYFNVLNGLALCCGALLGGFLLSWLPPLFGYKILTLLLISSILRFMAAFFLPLRLREVRAVKGIRSNELFLSVLGIRPLLDMKKTAAH